MNPVVSIIIPIYNSEAFLDSCIASLQSQSFRDFEALLIDDGSPDLSKEICQKIIAVDSRFKYFYKPNGGLSSARNFGLNYATGTYIAFLDSDDYVSSDFCEVLVKHAEKYQSEVLNFGYANVKKDVIQPVFSPLPKNQLIEKETLIQLISNSAENGVLYFAWSNFIRRDFFEKHNLRFDESVLLGEDSVFNLQTFMLTNRLFSISDCLYYYVHNDNSLTQKKYKPNLLAKFQTQFEVRIRLHNQYKEISGAEFHIDIARNYLENTLFMFFSNIRHSGQSSVNQLTEMYSSLLYHFCLKNYSPSGRLSFFMQFKVFLFRNRFFKLLSFIF